MGRRIGPVASVDGNRPGAPLLALGNRVGLAGVVLGSFLLAGAASAQTPAAAPPQRMVVEAKELVQDQNTNIVTATGDVQIYYKGRILEADRVVYNKNTGRVYAQGRAKLTEENGTVSFAETFDLTDDLKQGFIEGLRSESNTKTYLSSPRAEYAGDARVYDRTTYTACAPCENGDVPPLWRVRATKVIHRVDEQNLYFENARLEMFGFPLTYLPYFSIPDPSVSRRSGLLAPHFVFSTQYLGYGVGIPIFWAVAPNIDLTFTPTYFTTQGLLAELEWKHRLETGSYGVRLSGISPLKPSLFPSLPDGAHSAKFRGSIASAGEFKINERWKWGWDAAYLTDRYFLSDFQLYNPLSNEYYFREVASTAFLRGKGTQSFFDVRGFVFQGLSPRDYQPQIGSALPWLEYNRVFPVSHEKSFGLGGQFELDVNAMYVHAGAALYEPVHPRTVDQNGNRYVCQFYTPGLTQDTSQCLLRGVGGDYGRVTAQGSWQRRFIDPIGQTWTPFAFVRGSASFLGYDTSRTYPLYNYSWQPLNNASQSRFLGSDNNTASVRATPGIGFEYRYPFFSKTPIGSLTVEPIAQIIARPDYMVGSNSLVNIDAQNVVFDDSNLFSWNKFSGYDRFETGTRANYGGQFTLNLPNGGFVNAMAGQSVQLFGRNGYATSDAANAGLSSGLDSRRSDYVARFAIAPNSTFSFIAKGRFDVNTLALRRADLVFGATFGALNLTAQYANYATQPVIGFDVQRHGLAFGGKYDVTSNWFATANVTFDLSRHLYNHLSGTPAIVVDPETGNFVTVPQASFTGSAPVFSIASLNIGAGYHDDCSSFTVNYSSSYNPNTLGQSARRQKILFTFNLRTLAQSSFGYALGFTNLKDGITQVP